MSNTEINRQIVQDGLDRRAEDNKKRNDALEVDARILRGKINENHTEMRRQERMRSTASWKAQEEARMRRAEQEAEREEQRAQARQEAPACICWYQCMLRIFAPLFLAAICINLYMHKVIPMWLLLAILVAGITLSLLTLFVGFIGQAMEAQAREDVYS